jgi:hypothetical protein
MASYDIDTYTRRARSLLADGPRSREHLMKHGMPQVSVRMLQRDGVIGPKMQPWVNSEGRVIEAIERWQMAPPPPVAVRNEHTVERLDCAVMDFVAMGIG